MEIQSDPMPDMLAMPRFDDVAIDMQERLYRFVLCAGMPLRLSGSSSV